MTDVEDSLAQAACKGPRIMIDRPRMVCIVVVR